MKLNYQDYSKLSIDEKFKIFMDTLSLSNRTPEYYINWSKVIRNTKEFELELNTLNYLIGKEKIYDETLNLFNKQPELIKTVPCLIACRDSQIDLLTINEDNNMEYEFLDFYNIDINNIPFYVDFAQKTGLLDFLQNKATKSLVDYVYGVEVGLDSNGRKNRSGTTMESIVERFISNVCLKLDLQYLTQASAPMIKNQFGIKVPTDKSTRRFDFAVYCKRKNKLWLIETNYYGGGGSKLKAVAGEFSELSSFVKSSEDDVSFVWVTDGQGWKPTNLPLLEAFGHIDYVFNLKMLSEDYLMELFS